MRIAFQVDVPCTYTDGVNTINSYFFIVTAKLASMSDEKDSDQLARQASLVKQKAKTRACEMESPNSKIGDPYVRRFQILP